MHNSLSDNNGKCHTRAKLITYTTLLNFSPRLTAHLSVAGMVCTWAWVGSGAELEARKEIGSGRSTLLPTTVSTSIPTLPSFTLLHSCHDQTISAYYTTSRLDVSRHDTHTPTIQGKTKRSKYNCIIQIQPIKNNRQRPQHNTL